MSKDEKMQKIAEWREKAILEEKATRRYAMTEGRAEGQREKTEEIAKEMLKQGLTIESIISITKLTKEEVEKLKLQ